MEIRKQEYMFCIFGIILSDEVTNGSGKLYFLSGPVPSKAGKSCQKNGQRKTKFYQLLLTDICQ